MWAGRTPTSLTVLAPLERYIERMLSHVALFDLVPGAFGVGVGEGRHGLPKCVFILRKNQHVNGSVDFRADRPLLFHFYHF